MLSLATKGIIRKLIKSNAASEIIRLRTEIEKLKKEIDALNEERALRREKWKSDSTKKN